MKRILLIATMIVVLFASPVAADAPVVVAVDNKALSQYGVMINGSVYVPLRAVAEAMGAKAEWIGYTRTAYIYSNANLVVEGDANFKAVVGQALELLKSNDPTAYKLVCDNVKTIGVNDNAGNEESMAFTTHGSKRIDFTHKGIASEFFVPQYVASVIVHETVHCTQIAHTIETIKRDEAVAYLYQLNTLTILNAPQWMKDGCLNCMSRATK